MDNQFFRINGAEELQRGLEELSRGLQNKILRPGMRKGAAEVRKKAKKLARKDTGLMNKNIKSKVFTIKKGRKGVQARIGFLYSADIANAYYPQGAGQSKPTPVALVANTWNKQDGFLDSALSSTAGQANRILIEQTQIEIDKHWSKY